MPYIITTSRRPSQRLRSLVKELAEVLPQAHKVTRGKKTISDLYLEALELKATRIIICEQARGNPSLLKIYVVSRDPIAEPYEPDASSYYFMTLWGLTLRRELRESTVVKRVESIALQAPDDPLLFEVADKLSTILDVEIADPSRKYDILIELIPRRSVLEIRFISSANKKIAGPILRVKTIGHSKDPHKWVYRRR